MWQRNLGTLMCVCTGLLALGCGESSDDTPKASQGGSGSQAGSGGSSAGSNAGQGPGAGTSSGGAQPLPDGSKEYRGIVNLVDAEAAQVFDQYIADVDRFKGGKGNYDIEGAVRDFYLHYPDEYDFLFILNDHEVDSYAEGLHSWSSRPSLPGTGFEEPLCTGNGPGNLRSVVAIQVPSLDSFPPFAHEFAHHYAVGLAKELGFSRDVDTEFPGHWGLTGVNGQLGGFDPATLGCETPAGAKPPSCTATPTAGGRMRYTVAPFRPNADRERGQPFAPLELYLMGLLPAAEVPSPIVRFEGADFLFEAQEKTADGKLIIDASALAETTIAQIVTRHGEVPALPQDKRHFKAAVVLLTAAPATQPYLDRVADWAAIWAGEQESAQWPSFAELTGGRATISMKLGARRELGPDDVLEFTCPYSADCSPQAQDCPQGFACYGTSALFCAVPGVLDDGADCERHSDCKAGSVCSEIPTDFEHKVCSPYCDHVNASAPNACATLCPASFSPVYHTETLEELGAFCFGGSGGSCNPLTQDCEPGKACTGVELVSCEIPGDTKLGEVCLPFGATCEKGSVCVGVQGQPDQFCQPYCDPAPGAAAGTACTTKCPKGAWQYPGYGVCIP